MKYVIAFASVLACMVLLSPAASAQLGPAHFAAWDKHEGKRVVASRRVAKRAVVRTAYRAKRKTIQARISPPVAKTPVAAIANTTVAAVDATVALGEAAFETVTTVVKTPFGVLTGLSVGRVPEPIVKFLRQVSAQCGTVKVISTHRNGRGELCHGSNHAVDYQVPNPACAFALSMTEPFRRALGHSNDYHGVRALYGNGMPVHYHVSSCGREAGARFAHGGRSVRYARAKSRTRTAYRSGRVRYAQARRW